eukprot:CAMPEP_0171455494 /NCGR_PEP_ID=MMETSP0945-20130129/2365_1 /TAXON_ID=109269 /ORGANISM="Vaucheria litorea, Strain CCMP2940" /LENGTH=89 /DNA_ID=CAMNT_0011980743 /DNA_START=121 /DNA_END=390 /DNA_ORIENTATION=-
MLKITSFLNEFNLKMQFQFAMLNERLTALERNLELCENAYYGGVISSNTETSNRAHVNPESEIEGVSGSAPQPPPPPPPPPPESFPSPP